MQKLLTSFFIFIATVPFAAAQRNGGLPDIDLRETTSNEAATAAPATLRARALGALAATRQGAEPGLRIRANRHGLPKLMMREGQALTNPSRNDAESVSRDFLRRNSNAFLLSAPEVDQLRLSARDATPTGTFLTFTETIDGIDVFEGNVKFTMSAAGEIVQVAAGDLIPGVTVETRPTLSGADAEKIVRGSDARGEFLRAPELIVFPLHATEARLGYRLYFEADSTHSYEVVVDARDGRILYRHNNLKFAAAQGRVWKESPIKGSRELVDFPAAWLPDLIAVTTGNNVDAFVDATGDDRPDTAAATGMQGGRTVANAGVFDPEFGDGTTTQDPRNFKAASVLNVFYFANIAHDYFYSLGFTEASFNYQTDNFTNGGKGGDAVAAMSQHGLSTNNASFTPTPDGTPGRARFGIFTLGTSVRTDDRDSAYDGQVVIHEYGHGLSTRLVGGGVSTSCLNGVQSGAMGEGWSDYFGTSFFNNPVVGPYSVNNTTRGFRRQSYEGYTFGYEDIGNQGYEVHLDGEIWAATLWDLRKSLGQEVTDKLVVAGLKATPCSPSMVDARDAILSADQATNGGKNRAAIWTAFAKHGLGFSAIGVDGTMAAGTVYDAAADLPADLQPTRGPAITSKPLTVVSGLGQPYNYTVTATNPGEGTLLYTLVGGPSGLTINPATGVMSGNGSFISPRIKIVVTDGKGGRVVHGYMAPMLTPLTLGIPLTVAGAIDTSGVAYVDIPAGVPVLQFQTRGGSGDTDIYVTTPAGREYLSGEDGSDETVSFASPDAGRWKVEVGAYTAYSGVSLIATAVTPTPLPANGTITGLGGVITSERYYRIVVPNQAASIKVTTTGDGDVDLYLKQGSPAACQNGPCTYTSRAIAIGSNESVSAITPTPGDWYLALAAYDAYSNVTLKTETVLRVADMTITSRHTGVFRQGQKGATYSLVASNVGAVATTGAVTVTATLPAGLTATAVEGSGWTCTLSSTSCTRADALGPTLSYPEIVLTVDVSSTAPASITNSVAVSGGDDGNAANNTAKDITLVGDGGPAPTVLTGGVAPVYSSSTSIQPGAWISIYGSNFSTGVTEWNGDFPTTLGGVTVTVNGKPAYIWFVSPGQINVQAPDDSALGAADVVITNGNGSATAKVTLATTSPSFSLLGDGKHLAGVIPTPDGSGAFGGGAYDLLGPVGAFAFNTRPAKPGELVVLYGVGFGETVTPVPAGQIFTGASALAKPMFLNVGGNFAQIVFAGMTGAGLYQFNVVVPPNAASGDRVIQAILSNGIATPLGPVLSVQ